MDDASAERGTGAVAPEMVAAVWPAAQPGADPVLYGHVELTPRGAFEARSLQTFRLVYTVGRYGLDDTGSIRVVFRFVGDTGHLQTNDPAGYDYVSASCSGQGRIALGYAHVGHQRPWFKALTARLHGGFLREGDTVTIVFGDTAEGSPGLRLQTFCESGFEFKVLADVCAVGHYVPLAETPAIAIVPGPVHAWRAVLPSLRRPNEPFQLGIKAEDRWGNPTDRAAAELRLVPSLPVEGLPTGLRYARGVRAHTIEGLRVSAPGELRIRLLEGETCLAEAGPLMVRAGDLAGYWGDLHGQSGESIGINTAREYFDFARDKAFLDVTSHQANDFQVNNPFWAHLNELSATRHEDHRFVVFPGYEWSGNTAVGGDRNVFFRREGRPIRRSSHALIEDRSDLHTDAADARALFDALKDEDCVVYAHVGGRYADLAYAHDPRLETAMEIHSAWGTFEWLLTDGFALGHRSGVVCNSDGHKGRPGASYPGAANFGAYGGLTCFYAPELTRDAIFECLRRRHHFGTTGCRMHLDVRARFDGGARLYERDPAAFADAVAAPTTEAMMGDIVAFAGDSVTLDIEVAAHAPIERIEVRNGPTRVTTLRPYGPDDLGARLRVIWSGAEYRGRGRQTTWVGRARFGGSVIRRMEKINAWNPERLLAQRGSDTVEWQAITTGNFGGFDVWLDEAPAGRLDIATNHGALECALADIGIEDMVMEAGGLDRHIRVHRLPEHNAHRSLRQRIQVPLNPQGDNPIWVRVATEDGFLAWSSPIFVIR